MLKQGKRKRHVASHGATKSESDRIGFLKIIFDNCVSDRKRRRDKANADNLHLQGFNANEKRQSYLFNDDPKANESSINLDQLHDYADINARKMLSSSELEDGKHHLPLSVEDFQTRLASFDILHWNRVPDSICGFHCARFGWKLYRGKETDGLVCVTCKSFIPVPNTRLSVRGKEWGKQLRAAIESTHHMSTCPWRISFTPVTILSLPKSFEMFGWVRDSFSALHKSLSVSLNLVPPYDSIRDSIDLQWLAGIVGINREEPNGITDLQRRSLFLVMNGWSALAMHSENVISCHHCLRNVPLWTKVPESFPGTGINEEFDVNADIETATRNSVLVDPVNNHYWWCPWRRFLEFATAADVSDHIDLIEFESIYDRRFEDSAFLKNHASIEDYYRMKSYIEGECAQPLSLSVTKVKLQPKLLHSVSELMDGFLSISWLFDRSTESVSVLDLDQTLTSDEGMELGMEESGGCPRYESSTSDAAPSNETEPNIRSAIQVHACMDPQTKSDKSLVTSSCLTLATIVNENPHAPQGSSMEHLVTSPNIELSVGSDCLAAEALDELLNNEVVSCPDSFNYEVVPVSDLPEKDFVSQTDERINSKYPPAAKSNDQSTNSLHELVTATQVHHEDDITSNNFHRSEENGNICSLNGKESSPVSDHSNVTFLASSCVMESANCNPSVSPFSVRSSKHIQSPETQTQSKEPSVEQRQLLNTFLQGGLSVYVECPTGSDTCNHGYKQKANGLKQGIQISNSGKLSVTYGDAYKEEQVHGTSTALISDVPYHPIHERGEGQSTQVVQPTTPEMATNTGGNVLVTTDGLFSESQDDICTLLSAIVKEPIRMSRRSASEPRRCPKAARKRKFSESDQAANEVSILKDTAAEPLE